MGPLEREQPAGLRSGLLEPGRLDAESSRLDSEPGRLDSELDRLDLELTVSTVESIHLSSSSDYVKQTNVQHTCTVCDW